MEKILGSGAEPQFWAQVSLEIWFNGPVKAFDQLHSTTLLHDRVDFCPGYVEAKCEILTYK